MELGPRLYPRSLEPLWITPNLLSLLCLRVLGPIPRLDCLLFRVPRIGVGSKHWGKKNIWGQFLVRALVPIIQNIGVWDKFLGHLRSANQSWLWAKIILNRMRHAHAHDEYRLQAWRWCRGSRCYCSTPPIYRMTRGNMLFRLLYRYLRNGS